jgi:hypothetical protein
VPQAVVKFSRLSPSALELKRNKNALISNLLYYSGLNIRIDRIYDWVADVALDSISQLISAPRRIAAPVR